MTRQDVEYSYGPRRSFKVTDNVSYYSYGVTSYAVHWYIRAVVYENDKVMKYFDFKKSEYIASYVQNKKSFIDLRDNVTSEGARFVSENTFVYEGSVACGDNGNMDARIGIIFYPEISRVYDAHYSAYSGVTFTSGVNEINLSNGRNEIVAPNIKERVSQQLYDTLDLVCHGEPVYIDPPEPPALPEEVLSDSYRIVRP